MQREGFLHKNQYLGHLGQWYLKDKPKKSPFKQ